MDYSKLAKVLRERADKGLGSDHDLNCETIKERVQRSPLPPDMIEVLVAALDAARLDAELLRVLARILEGKPIDRAFGAPGDYGYNTPIGAALYDAYRGSSS